MNGSRSEQSLSFSGKGRTAVQSEHTNTHFRGDSVWSSRCFMFWPTFGIFNAFSFFELRWWMHHGFF